MYYLAVSETRGSWETPEILAFRSPHSRDEWLEADEVLRDACARPISGKEARAYIVRALTRAYDARQRFGLTRDEIRTAPIEDLILAYKECSAWTYDDGGVLPH